MSILDENIDIPIESLLMAADWKKVSRTRIVDPFGKLFYPQQVTLIYYRYSFARLEHGREQMQNGDYFIDLEFWPKGSKYINRKGHLIKLKKHLVVTEIRHSINGASDGIMRHLYVKTNTDFEAFKFLEEIQNGLYIDHNQIIRKYKGKYYI